MREQFLCKERRRLLTITSGDRMAAKSILGKTYSYEDLFDTYDTMLQGKQNTVGYSEQVQKMDYRPLGRYSNPRLEERTGFANADNVGSILGKTAELEAFKTRRKQQTNLQSQGVGRSQSILGGSLV